MGVAHGAYGQEILFLMSGLATGALQPRHGQCGGEGGACGAQDGGGAAEGTVGSLVAA